MFKSLGLMDYSLLIVIENKAPNNYARESINPDTELKLDSD